MTNLATLDEFKTYAGIKNPENDDRTESILSSVSSLIKTYCGRTFNDYVNDTYEEYFDGGQEYFYPREFPILDVSGAGYSSDNGLSYTDLSVDAGELILDRRSDRFYIPSGLGVSGINAIKIEYNGGYEKIPGDLKLAVYDMVQMYMKAETVPKRTQGFASVEYITSADFPAHIKRVLDLYRVL